MTLIASSRMYNVSPAVSEAWAALFTAISEQAGIAIEVLDYPPPKPIDALWARDDMGLVFMCGWPYSRSNPKPALLAAPVPSDPHAEGLPVYWSDMIVRADSPFQTLEDTFGHRLCWTVRNSHSGYNAPRKLLVTHAIQRGAPLYASSLGELVSPMGVINAVLENRAEVAPLDGFFHQLLQRHAPDLADQIRSVAQTPKAPIPVIVASHSLPAETIDTLRHTLLNAHLSPRMATLLDALCISRFAAPATDAYAIGDEWEAAATAAGYPELM